MSLPNVNITLANGQLGAIVQTTDGITGMVLTGASEGSITAGTPFLVTSFTDAQNQGLTNTTNPFAYRQVQEFYNEAAVGTQLYLMLVISSMKVHQMTDKTNANGAIKLLNFAAGKVRILGVMTDDSAVYPSGAGLTTTNGINADCYTAITNMQALTNQFFTAQKPLRGIVAGTSFTGTATALTDQAASSNNRVSCLIGNTQNSSAAALGLLMGRLAAIPVQRKISRVKNGALSTTTAYIGSTSADLYTSTETIFDKGFITFRSFPGKSGFFFSGDATCTATTDDYASLARGRVIDKAQILTYAVFVNEVDNEVLVNADGTLNAGYIKTLEQSITNQVNLIMTANNEISGIRAFIDPAQNVISTSQVNIVLKITPVGYSSDIEIKLGFDNPALS